MEVQVRYPLKANCLECGGSGMVTNDLWAKWWEQVQAWREAEANRRWAVPAHIQEPAEPEELLCHECEGQEYGYRWVPVESLVTARTEAAA